MKSTCGDNGPPLRWHQTSGPRQRPRLAALSGSQTKAPGSAGGYLLCLCMRVMRIVHMHMQLDLRAIYFYLL
jgi:hypothetical protein